jgi:hypothetical protein
MQLAKSLSRALSSLHAITHYDGILLTAKVDKDGWCAAPVPRSSRFDVN